MVSNGRHANTTDNFAPRLHSLVLLEGPPGGELLAVPRNENGRLVDRTAKPRISARIGWFNAPATSPQELLRVGSSSAMCSCLRRRLRTASLEAPQHSFREVILTDLDQSATEPSADDASKLATWTNVYVALAARRTAFDTLLWQTPSLGLAAQAFLFTIALSPDSSDLARFISAALSLVTSLVAIQTMAKHRYNELTDAISLERIERGIGVTIGGHYPHQPPRVRGAAVGNTEKGIIKLRTFDLWLFSLGSFALASIGVMVITIVAPGKLG